MVTTSVSWSLYCLDFCVFSFRRSVCSVFSKCWGLVFSVPQTQIPLYLSVLRHVIPQDSMGCTIGGLESKWILLCCWDVRRIWFCACLLFVVVVVVSVILSGRFWSVIGGFSSRAVFMGVS